MLAVRQVAIRSSIFITFDAVCVRSFFQSEMAALFALSDRKAHSGLGLV